MSPGKSCLCLVCLCFCCGPHFGLAPSLWLPDAAPLLGSPVFVLCLVVVVVVVVLVPVGSIWWLPVVDAAALLETGTPYSISPNGPWELLSCVLLLLLLWLLSSQPQDTRQRRDFLTGAQHPVTTRMEPSQNEDHNKNKDTQDKDRTSQGSLVSAVRSSPLV